MKEIMNKQERFETFLRRRDELNDWEEYLSPDKTGLVRQRILEQCGFPRSTLYQNSEIKTGLVAIEGRLRAAGIIKREHHHDNGELFEEAALLDAAAALELRVNNLVQKIAALNAVIDDTRAKRMKYHGEI